jgi:hypothetical protein
VTNSRPIVENFVLPHAAFADALNRVERCYSFAKLKAEAEGLAIIGESGTGKTSVLQTFRDNYLPTRDENGMKIPVLLASVPSSPTVKSLAGVLLEALHASDPERGTENEKSRRIRVLMKETGTRMVMIDEFQHFYDRGTQKIMHHVADWLKILIDQTQTTLVISGLPTCLGVIDQNEQLMRRFSSPIRLTRFDWQVPKDREQFIGLLAMFHEELGKRYIAPKFHSEQMAFRFWQATSGLMGYLSKLLRQVERNALVEERTEISLKDLHTAHMESIWFPQRLQNLPQPFKEQSATVATIDLIERVNQIGAVIALPQRLGPRKATTARKQSLNDVLVAG